MHPTLNLSTNLMEIQESLKPLRLQLMQHPIYSELKTMQNLCIFMEHHVFAVWDFMSLLKALQKKVTCVETPWLPTGNAGSRRFINEIVLGEESDDNGKGGYLSHFEMYLQAMQEAGADDSRIRGFLDILRNGENVSRALEKSKAPQASINFVKTTWEMVETQNLPVLATAFTLGREELIPDMFRELVHDLKRKFPGKLELFCFYLERHIELDENHHTPMAFGMLQEICGMNELCWQQAGNAAEKSLRSRIELWNGVCAEMKASRTL